MSLVRVPIAGTVGKAVRIDPDATQGATLGVNLYDENGNVLDAATLAALLSTDVANIVVEQQGTVNPAVFESDIVPGDLLARNADNELITGAWDFSADVDLVNGAALQIYDAAGTSNLELSHIGTYASVAALGIAEEMRFFANQYSWYGQAGLVDVMSLNPTRLEIRGGVDLWLRDFGRFRIYDLLNDGYSQSRHNGSNFITTFVNTGAWQINDVQTQFRDGPGLRIYDALNDDYAEFIHDGIDFNTAFIGTADWNITGLAGRVLQGAETLAYVSEIEANLSGLGTWRFRSGTTPPPASGDILFNAVLVADATEFYLHETNDDGTDVSEFFDILLNPGAVLYVQAKDDATAYVYIEVGTSVDNGTYRTFQIVNILGSSGIGSAPPQGTPLVLVATSGTGLGGFLPGPTVAGSTLRSDGIGSWFEETQVQISAAGELTIFDSLLTSSGRFSHDGTDFNSFFASTLDWNITGLNAIQAGGVDLDVDALTATSYGGIPETNLLNKDATEIRSGAWTISGATYFSFAPRLSNNVRLNALNAAATVNVNLAYLSTSDKVVLAHPGLETLIQGSAIELGGNTNVTGVTTISGGSSAAPGLAFSAEPNTGIYRGAAGRFDISILGAQLFQLDNVSGLQIVGNIGLTGLVDGRDVAADGTTQDAHIADGTIHFTEASIDHTAILNIGANSHVQIDAHIAEVNEHIDWTADQGGTQINVNNLGPDQMSTTPRNNVIQYQRWGANQDMGGVTNWAVGAYGGYSTMINGPSTMAYDPFLVLGSGSDVRSFLYVPYNTGASKTLAWKGSGASGATHYPWLYAGWASNVVDANLSLYQKSAANTLDAVVTNGDTINVGSGLVELQIPSGAGSIEWNVDTLVGGWARGHAFIRKSDGARIAGVGVLGSAEAAVSYHVGFGSTWWGADSTLDLTTALFTVGNYSFDIDQTVGVGQDNYVLTYDNGTGLISLEAAGAGGGTIGGSIANDQVAVGAATANDIEGSSALTFVGGILTTTGGLNLNSAGPVIDYASGYVSLRTGTAGANGLRLYNSASATQGYIYSDGAGTFGMLHSTGGWAIQIAPAGTSVTVVPNLNANNGIDVTGNLIAEAGATLVQSVAYNKRGVDYWYANNSGAVTANSWYTIATDPLTLDITTTPVGKTGASRAAARIRVWDIDSGQHSFCEFEVACNYGRRPTVTMINRSAYGSGNTGVRGIRVVRNGTYNGVAIQVLAGHTGTLYCSVQTLHTGGFYARDFLAQTPEATWKIDSVDFNNYGADMRFMVATGPTTPATDTCDGIGVGDGRFYPALDGANVGAEMGYFAPLAGNYGSVNVVGCSGSTGTWAGYSIENEYVLMSYSGAGRVGLFNDLDNQWMMQCYRLGAVELYYNGATVTETMVNGLRIHESNDAADYIEITQNGTDASFAFGSTSRVNFSGAASIDMLGGMDIRIRDAGQLFIYNSADTDYAQFYHDGTDFVTTCFASSEWEIRGAAKVAAFQTVALTSTGEVSGLKIADHATTNMRYAGFADSIESRTNTSFTMGAQDVGNVAHYTNGSSYNATLAASTNLDFPVNARMDFINRAAGICNINQGTGTTLYWADGDGTMSTGNRDLGYGWATIWRQSATVYYLTGNGIT